MAKTSTHLFQTTNDHGIRLAGCLEEQIRMMEDMDEDLLVAAPEAAVGLVLGFAASYANFPSVMVDEIEFSKN